MNAFFENCSQALWSRRCRILEKRILRLERQWKKKVLRYADCVYLEFTVPVKERLTYHLGKEVGTVEPVFCRETPQSPRRTVYRMRVAGGKPCNLDFRYFIMFGNGMARIRTYSWSEDIKQAVIKNRSNVVFEFNGYEIPKRETKSFTRDTHTQELFVPELVKCRNGKEKS